MLASWAALVVDERAVSGPGGRNVGELAAFLATHLDWLGAHPAAQDFADEIAELAHAADNVLHPNPTLHMELGPCAEPGCDQMVSATVRAEDAHLPPQVGCSAGHVCQPHQWLLMAGQIHQAMRGHLARRSEHVA
ncbi:MAG: hypothetical protein GEU98_02690 [Pseudonocardiaceae bacterium]|nr:hypothetical protein [Pseudonocardiaceae bacterium]